MQPDGRVHSADIVLKDGLISEISHSGDPSRADRVIDAKDNFVLPGIIDTHTHMGDPAFPEREDFTSGTAAAVSGGVTTILEMPSSIPPVSDPAAFTSRSNRIAGRAYANIGLYAGAGFDNLSEIEPMSDQGAVAFKTYLQRPPLGREREHAGMHAYDDDQIRETFSVVSKTGKLLVVHAEDDATVSRLTSKFRDEGRNDMGSFLESRPAAAEVRAVKRSLKVASHLGAGTKLGIAHISTRNALELLAQYKLQKSFRIYVEGRPDYLLFDEKDALRFGAFLKTYPPLRTKKDRAAIVEAINRQTIDYFGSDHAPRTRGEKQIPDLWRVPAGTPSIEILLRTLLDLVSKKQIELASIVRMQRTAARAFGLSNRGEVTVGSIADLVLIDLKSTCRIESDRFQTRSKESAVVYDGLKLTGKPLITIVGGRIVMENGVVLKETLGAGQFVQFSQVA